MTAFILHATLQVPQTSALLPTIALDLPFRCHDRQLAILEKLYAVI